MTTPSGELRLSPAHLRDLADRHGDAATAIAAATGLTDGIADAILRSHGAACSAAAAAAATVAEARERACLALAATSQAHQANLDTAAAAYAWTDTTEGASIDHEMPGKSR